MKIVSRKFIDHVGKIGDGISTCLRLGAITSRRSNDELHLREPPPRIRARRARTFDELDNLERYANDNNSLEFDDAALEGNHAQMNRGNRK